jgi:hypothetical protein
LHVVALGVIKSMFFQGVAAKTRYPRTAQVVLFVKMERDLSASVAVRRMQINATVGRTGVVHTLTVGTDTWFEDKTVAFPIIPGGIVDINRMAVGKNHFDLFAEVRAFPRYSPCLSTAIAGSIAAVGFLLIIFGTGLRILRRFIAAAAYRGAVVVTAAIEGQGEEENKKKTTDFVHCLLLV